MSLIKKLREEKKSNEEFEVMLKHLTLEEMFSLRLELEDQSFKGNLSGYKMYFIIRDVISEGLIKFALDYKKTKRGAAKFLGLDKDTLERNMMKYKLLIKNKKPS
jgi:DNA-binding protein Fis